MPSEKMTRPASVDVVRPLTIVAPLAAAIMLAAVNLVMWYPGEPNNDSDSQLVQIREGVFNDWHPPAMTRLWEFLLNFGSGSAPLFVFNILMYWAAPALIAATLMRAGHRLSGWATLMVFAIPTFIMQNINITKDVHFAVVVLVAFALVFTWRAGDRKVPVAVKGIAAILIVYAILVRINAAFIAVPILAYLVQPRWLRRPVILALLTLPVGLLLVPVISTVNHHVLLAHDAGAIRSLQLFDLGGIAARTGDMGVFGPESSLGYAEVKRCYSPTMWDTMREDGRCPGLVGQIGRKREDAFVRLPPLGDLWTAAIIRHPDAYVMHRLANFNSATYFIEPNHHFDAVRQFDTAVARQPSIKNQLLDLVRYLPPLMPGVLLSLGLGFAILLIGDRALRNRTEPFGAVALVLAALAYGFSFLVVGVATDLRYFFFSDLAVLLAAVLITASSAPAQCQSGEKYLARLPLALGICVLAVGLIATVGARIILRSPKPAQTIGHVRQTSNLSVVWSEQSHV